MEMLEPRNAASNRRFDSEQLVRSRGDAPFQFAIGAGELADERAARRFLRGQPVVGLLQFGCETAGAPASASAGQTASPLTRRRRDQECIEKDERRVRREKQREIDDARQAAAQQARKQQIARAAVVGAQAAAIEDVPENCESRGHAGDRDDRFRDDMHEDQ